MHPDFFIFKFVAWCGTGDGSALVGSIWLATGTLSECGRASVLQRNRPTDGIQREKEVGTFSLGLPKVPTAKLS